MKSTKRRYCRDCGKYTVASKQRDAGMPACNLCQRAY